MTTILIINKSKPAPSIHAILAKSFISKLLGLMFRKNLPEGSGVLLAETSESKLNTSIHMLFMNFDICAVWINKVYQVVDVKKAKRWHLAYFPRNAAKFVLEVNTQEFNNFTIGDQLQFDYEN
jgi:uncharacterized protein